MTPYPHASAVCSCERVRIRGERVCTATMDESVRGGARLRRRRRVEVVVEPGPPAVKEGPPPRRTTAWAQTRPNRGRRVAAQVLVRADADRCAAVPGRLELIGHRFGRPRLLKSGGAARRALFVSLALVACIVHLRAPFLADSLHLRAVPDAAVVLRLQDHAHRQIRDLQRVAGRHEGPNLSHPEFHVHG